MDSPNLAYDHIPEEQIPEEMDLNEEIELEEPKLYPVSSNCVRTIRTCYSLPTKSQEEILPDLT
jgi:hypothetical protein